MKPIKELVEAYFTAELAKVKIEMDRAKKANDMELVKSCARVIAIIEQVKGEYENKK